MFTKKLEDRISILESKEVECKILQPELLREKDVLTFNIKTDMPLSTEELITAREQFKANLLAKGIHNEILVTNNIDLGILRTIV